MQTLAAREQIGDIRAGFDRLQPDLSLHAETLASLCATSSQHLTAALGRHTSTETVALSPLTSVRLIRALHIISLSWF